MPRRRKARRIQTVPASKAEPRPAGDAAWASRWRDLTRILTPERVVLVLGLVFGLTFVLLTPPFQVPDEPSHFYRSFQVSELRPLSVVNLNRGFRLGTSLPKSLATLVDTSDVVNVRFMPNKKVDPAKLLPALRVPLNAHDREILPVLPYPPLGYIPQAAGIGVGRLLGGSPLLLLYLARLGALLAWLGFVYLAVRTTPVLKWTFVLLSLMPMTLYLAASTSADSVVIGASFLLAARLLSWAYDDTKTRIGGAEVAWVLGLACVIALSKALYLPVLLLFFLVPRAKFGGWTRYLATFFVIFAVAVAAFVGWVTLARWAATAAPGITLDLTRHVVDGSYVPNVSPGRQIAFIRAHPGTLVNALVTTVSAPKVLFFYLNSFVGMLGWLDTLLPTWLPYAYLAILVGASIVAGSRAPIGWTDRALALGVFTLTALVALVWMYVTYTSVGMVVVVGFQGRYLIPATPVLFLIFPLQRPRWDLTKLVAPALVAVVLTTSSVAVYRLVMRFYVAEVPWYAIEAAIIPSTRDVLIVRGWALDRETRAVVEAVDIELEGRAYRARYGLDRLDVAQRLSRPSYRYSGFEAHIPMNEVGRGQRSIVLRIVTKDRTYLVPESKANFNVK
jgi:uncharacterized membrane protein